MARCQKRPIDSPPVRFTWQHRRADIGTSCFISDTCTAGWVFSSLGQATSHKLHERPPADLAPSCQAWSCKKHRSRSLGRSTARFPSKTTGEPSGGRNGFKNQCAQPSRKPRGDICRVHVTMVHGGRSVLVGGVSGSGAMPLIDTIEQDVRAAYMRDGSGERRP